MSSRMSSVAALGAMMLGISASDGGVPSPQFLRGTKARRSRTQNNTNAAERRRKQMERGVLKAANRGTSDTKDS